jgi:hypothetical protein
VLKLKVTEDGVVPLLIEADIQGRATVRFHAVAKDAVKEMVCDSIGNPVTPLNERVCGVTVSAETAKDQTAPEATPEKPTESTRQK